jgi:hypothetical protein
MRKPLTKSYCARSFIHHFTYYFGPTEQIVIQFRINFTVEILLLKNIYKWIFHKWFFKKSHVSYILENTFVFPQKKSKKNAVSHEKDSHNWVLWWLFPLEFRRGFLKKLFIYLFIYVSLRTLKIIGLGPMGWGPTSSQWDNSHTEISHQGRREREREWDTWRHVLGGEWIYVQLALNEPILSCKCNAVKIGVGSLRWWACEISTTSKVPPTS